MSQTLFFFAFCSSKVFYFRTGNKFPAVISKISRCPPSNEASEQITPTSNGIAVPRLIVREELGRKQKMPTSRRTLQGCFLASEVSSYPKKKWAPVLEIFLILHLHDLYESQYM